MPDGPDDSPPLDPRLLQWMDDRNRFAEQNEEGVDMSLIEANLKLTADERLRNAHRLRCEIERLRDLERRIPPPTAEERRALRRSELRKKLRAYLRQKARDVVRGMT